MKVGMVLVVKIGPNEVQCCEKKNKKTGIVNMPFLYFELGIHFKAISHIIANNIASIFLMD